MLRRVYLNNFVKFEGRQIIDFEEGENPYIFVGENGSGKSSLLEGIRRCLSQTTSTTTSSVFDKKKPGFCICKFDTRKCSEQVLKGCESMFAGIIRNQTENTIYKFASTETELLIEKKKMKNILKEEKEGNEEENCGQFQTTENAKKIFDELENNIFDELENNILNFDDILNRQFTNTANELERRLNILTRYVILTFPSRSIGPLQWTKSDKITSDKRIENYKEAGARAEIIDYFLRKQDEFDLDIEQEIFRDLTGHTDIKFDRGDGADGEINVHSTSIDTVLPGQEYALLKLPEGILEAKHFSILMSHKTCLTLILEEPDRGMHPQMVDRMLAIIQKESYKKMVILTTHNASFINPLTITRLVIFKRVKGHSETILGKTIAKIKLPRLSDYSLPKETASMVTLRTLTRDHLADLIFAKRILFCEGDSDYLFLSALKEKVMKRAACVEYVFNNILTDDNIDTLQRVCVSLQIITMNGWSNAQLMHTVCSNNNLKLDDHYFLCDKDSILTGNDKAVKHDNKWIATNPKVFNDILTKHNTRVKEAGEKYDESLREPGKDMRDELKKFRKSVNDGWDEVRKYLREDCKCFAWKDGTIEDMVISLLRCEMPEKEIPDEDGSKKRYRYDTEFGFIEKKIAVDELKRQNVDLPYKKWKLQRSEREDRESKLFLSAKITEENIAESMKILLNACNDKADDLVQFILFLLRMENA